jgi:hypothetical protein
MKILRNIFITLLIIVTLAISHIYAWSEGFQQGGDRMAVMWLEGCQQGMTIDLDTLVLRCAKVKKYSP